MSYLNYLNPTDLPKHPDTSFPMSPNGITLRSLTNSITLSDTPPDASGSPPNPILTLISTVRQQLLDHKSYLEPYLKCLHQLCHAKQGTEQQRLRKIRPTKPADSDVRDFFLSHWPEVHLRDDAGPRYPWKTRVEEHVYVPVNPLNDAIRGNPWLASDLMEKVTMGFTCSACRGCTLIR